MEWLLYLPDSTITIHSVSLNMNTSAKWIQLYKGTLIYLIISFCLSFGVLEEILKVLWDLEKQIHTVNRRINGGCGTAFVGVSTNPPFGFGGFGGFDEFIELNTNPPFGFGGFGGFDGFDRPASEITVVW